MADIKEFNEAAAPLERDFYVYNGALRRGPVLNVMESIGRYQQSPKVTLLLVTNGGDPDAAFKVCRYLQERYDSFTLLVSGLCKSAGTLVALGAEEIAFTPYGELGPLDIQMSKVDKFEQMQSGLVISDSLNTLEERALAVYFRIAKDLIAENQGMISFASASQAAVEAMKSIYAPVLGKIDPEEIGVRSRAMRIAQDYGLRLSSKWGNPKGDTLRLLAETYSSHSFVIDRAEAERMFERVRSANEHEKKIVALLGDIARSQKAETCFLPIHQLPDSSSEEENETVEQPGVEAGHGADSEAAAAAPGAEAAANDGQLVGFDEINFGSVQARAVDV